MKTENTDDHLLVPMVKEAEAITGQKAEKTLSDSGYHCGKTLAECKGQGLDVLMPDPQHEAQESPYHKDKFSYDAERDIYLCPEGKELTRTERAVGKDGSEGWSYQAHGKVCINCPAFGVCTNDRDGRRIKCGAYDELLKRHRALMKTKEARKIYALRKEMVEPAFGIIKDRLGLRRFLLKGRLGAEAEWLLTTVAFNLLALSGLWRRQRAPLPARG